MHFLAIGSVLFALEQALRTPDAAPQTPVDAPIELSAVDVQRQRAQWRRETGREPNDGELRASLRAALDEEMLLREALRLGLDERDPVARERMIKNLRFAYADERGDDETLLRRARALGMARQDMVVRRRLVQVMEQRLASAVEVRRDEVREYIAAHPERYAAPARLAFRQVFVSQDAAHAVHAAPEARARALLAQLRAGAAAENLGDAFLLGASFPPSSEPQLARSFGADFARALMQVPQGEWSGPLRSAYGWHLVQPTGKQESQPADSEAVMQQAAYAWLAEREQAQLRERMAELRRRYGIAEDAPLRVAGVGP